MAAKSFTLLTRFLANKYFSVAKQGVMPVGLPRSIGVLFTLGTNVESIIGSGNTLLSDALTGNGFLLAQTPTMGGGAPIGVYDGADPFGTPFIAFSGLGSTNNSQGGGANPAGNAYTSNEQILLNQFASVTQGNALINPGGGDQITQAVLTPQASRMVLVVVTEEMVGPDAVATMYINGQQVGSQIYTPVSNQTSPFFLGVDPLGIAPASNSAIAGWFISRGAMNVLDIALMQAACVQAKDLVAPATKALDYIWSAKYNLDFAAGTWLSKSAPGVAPVSMVQTGTWSAAADMYAADYPWA